MPYNLAELDKLTVTGLTFGSCTTELNERPHPYRWIEDRHSGRSFRVLRLGAGTEAEVGLPALTRLKQQLEQTGMCNSPEIGISAAGAAGAMDLFMRAWPDQLEFDRIDGRCTIVETGLPRDVPAATSPPTATASRAPAPSAVPTELQDWLQAVFAPGDRHIELFNTRDGQVTTIQHGRPRVEVFERHPDMTARVRELAKIVVESPDHCGLLYCMYRLDEDGRIRPRYVGIANWRGKDANSISGNFEGVSTGSGNARFARWGYAIDWHFGQISAAALRGSEKYSHWVEDLFEYDSLPLTPPYRLESPVYWSGVAWPCPAGKLASGDSMISTPACRDWTGATRTLEEIERVLVDSFDDLLNKQRGSKGCSRARCGADVKYPCPSQLWQD